MKTIRHPTVCQKSPHELKHFSSNPHKIRWSELLSTIISWFYTIKWNMEIFKYFTSSKEFNENKPEDNVFETCWNCNKPYGFSIRVSPHFWVLSQWFRIFFFTDSFIQSLLLNENNQMLQPLQFFAFSLSVQQESCKVFGSQSLIGYYSSFFL